MTPEQRHRCMAAVKGRDTKPEMLVRKFLFSKGLRYRVNNRRLPGSPDIVLKKYKTAIFIDGCFWHGHDGCRYYRQFKTNTHYWRPKKTMNNAPAYAPGADPRPPGWRAIPPWEREIRPHPCRAATLDRLYLQITGTPPSSTYPAIPSELPLAAESTPAYGPEKQ